jgi:hypothetical protein
MRFGLIIRGQYPQGDDMRVRSSRHWPGIGNTCQPAVRDHEALA